MKLYIRILLIIISAALSVLAFPHPDQGWLIWFALIPGIIAVYKLNFWKSLLIGEIYGFIFIFFKTRWFGFFGWEPHLFGSFYFGFFFALFFALVGRCSNFQKPGTGWISIILPPLFWVATEYLKAQGVLAFTWGFLAFSQYKFIPLIQIASITGVYGISFLILLWNALLAEIILTMSQLRETGPTGELHKESSTSEKIPPANHWKNPVGALREIYADPKYRILKKASIAVPALLGLVILAGYLSIPASAVRYYEKKGEKPIRVGVVQPNLPQNLKWKPESLEPTMNILTEETHKLALENAELVIWPETAIPHSYPMGVSSLNARIRNTAVANRIYLITGLVDWIGSKNYNGAILIDRNGTILDRYHKIHLVPLAEYMPWEYLRRFKIFDRTGHYDIGTNRTVFTTSEGKFSTLICFESYFDYLARQMVAEGAEFLMVLTNDAWYEYTNEAKIHFIMAVFRSVENRVWLVQSSNTGVSGVIDPWGRIVHETKLFEKTSFTGEIYKSTTNTPYNSLGNWFPILSIMAGLVLMLIYCPLVTKK